MKTFKQLIQEAKKYTIYKDRWPKKTDTTYTVYQGKKFIGQFLGDEPEFEKIKKNGEMKDGIVAESDGGGKNGEQELTEKEIDGVKVFGKMDLFKNTWVANDKEDYIIPRGFPNWKAAVKYIKKHDPKAVEAKGV